MKLPDTARVWIHRSRAIAWVIIGALSFPLGYASSVTLVWIASLYANIASDWSSAEAADNREVLKILHRIEKRLDELEKV